MAPLKTTAGTFQISVTDDLFSPNGLDAGQTFTVNVGDTVVWTLKSSNVHTIEKSDSDGNPCGEPDFGRKD
jgi:plastocyanin